MALTPFFFKVDSGAKTPAQIKANIASLDNIIDELLKTALVSVQSGNIAEYELDTGQSRQVVKYSSTTSVINAVKGYEKLRVYYQNKLTSPMVRLMDSKNFR